jgi:uncharacterized repeat protein (TIGR01451 family)
MFEKLLSLVPYNPGLLPQLSFYSRRMREEASIRRTGTVFLVLAFMLQFFAVLSPPQSTVAASDNDIINGGVSSISDARAKCVADIQGFQRILHYYGISCSAFDSAYDRTINKNNMNYYSMGRNTSNGVDTPVNVPGQGNKVYWRPLTTWKTKSEWRTIHVDNQDGKNFYIMYDCGNLVTVGIPTPSPYHELTVTKNPRPAPPPAYNPTPVIVPKPTTPTPTPPQLKPPCKYNPAITADSVLCQPPCEYNSLLFASDASCKPCDKSVSSADKTACISVRKEAKNVTLGNTDANNTTVKANDVIIYTLFAENKGKATVKGFVFQENLSDVLDYADVFDLRGGSIDKDKVVVWPAIDIKADESRSVQITVKVRDPIPQTPVSSSDPAHFDLVMTNVYGNAINIKLPGAPAKQVEIAAAALPNTGPGTSLMIAAAVVILASYFYSRATLLARESEIAVKETALV